MTAVVVSAREARACAGRIRAGMRTYLETLGDVATAYRDRHWEALGYDGWDAYVEGEFSAARVRLSPEHQQKAINELRLAGMSVRAIGSALGVPKSEVGRSVVPGGTPDEVRGIDGKTYSPARSPVVEAMTEAIEDAERRAQEHPLERGESAVPTTADPDGVGAPPFAPAPSVTDHRGGTPGDPNPDPLGAGSVSDAAAGAYLPPAAAPMTERIEEDTDHPDAMPGEADVVAADSAPEGAGTSDHITPAPSGPPCEACGAPIGLGQWNAGFMRCADCDPGGDHLAGEDGCQICAVCPTCGKPRWSTT